MLVVVDHIYKEQGEIKHKGHQINRCHNRSRSTCVLEPLQPRS